MNEQTVETDPLTERDWLFQILGRMEGLNVSRPMQRQAIEQVYGRVMDAIIEAGWESDESAALRGRMADLLRRTANAIKGEPGPLMSHDWSDLPDVAARVVRGQSPENDALTAAVKVTIARVRCEALHGQTNGGRCAACVAWSGRNVARYLPRFQPSDVSPPPAKPAPSP